MFLALEILVEEITRIRGATVHLKIFETVKIYEGAIQQFSHGPPWAP